MDAGDWLILILVIVVCVAVMAFVLVGIDISKMRSDCRENGYVGLATIGEQSYCYRYPDGGLVEVDAVLVEHVRDPQYGNYNAPSKDGL